MTARAALLASLLLAEMLALAVLWQFFATVECHLTDVAGFCRFLRSLVARGLVAMAVAAVLLWARPGLFSAVVARPGRRRWIVLHLAGLALMVLPLLRAPNGDVGAIFGVAAVLLTVGALLTAWGWALWLAPAESWRRLLHEEGRVVLPALAGALILPDLAEAARPLWSLDALAGVTFSGVAGLLALTGATVMADPGTRVIGVDSFAVAIAPSCSGVEGMALVLGFSALQALVFRESLRQRPFWLVVVPLAVLASFALNILRVAALIGIGAHVSPQLAVDGFHSHAGWLFFTLLALGMVAAVQAIPALHHGRAPGPARDDALAAQILPLLVFLVVSLLTHALFPHPEIGYPLRAIALAAVLWRYRRFWLGLNWRPDVLALLAGLVIGLAWIGLETPDPAAGEALAMALSKLTPELVAFWVVLRVFGTVLLVPLAEELFFRSYLLTLLTGPIGRILAVCVSSALFGLLHGRWVMATVAGVAFALLAIRGRGVAAAVQAHTAANLIVAIWALMAADFTRI